MELVPFAFCNSVAALWKPRDGDYPEFVDSKWTFSDKRYSTFYIDASSGDWKYAFLYKPYHEPKKWLNVDQFVQLIVANKWKNVLLEYIVPINVLGSRHPQVSHSVGGDIGRILNFASSLCNEPHLNLYSMDEEFNCTRGSILLRWLEERWFSKICIRNYHSFYNRLIEKQFSRWKPTLIDVRGSHDDGGAQYFQEHILARNIKCFTASQCTFPALVLETIIRNVLENPEDYAPGDFQITAPFDGRASEMLGRMYEEGLCRVEGYNTSELNCIFDKQLPHLRMQRQFCGWKIYL